MMLEQCRTASFLLVLQETVAKMLSKVVNVVSQDLSSRGWITAICGGFIDCELGTRI